MNEQKINDEPAAAENESTASPQSAQNAPTSDILNNPDVIAYIEKQVAEGIKKALQGKPPKAAAVDTAQEKKQFEKMTYKERLNLFKTNPQTYYKLTKGEN